MEIQEQNKVGHGDSPVRVLIIDNEQKFAFLPGYLLMLFTMLKWLRMSLLLVGIRSGSRRWSGTRSSGWLMWYLLYRLINNTSCDIDELIGKRETSSGRTRGTGVRRGLRLPWWLTIEMILGGRSHLVSVGRGRNAHDIFIVFVLKVSGREPTFEIVHHRCHLLCIAEQNRFRWN